MNEEKVDLQKFVPESAPAEKTAAANPALVEAAKEALELQKPIEVKVVEAAPAAIVPVTTPIHTTENPKVAIPPAGTARIVVVARDAHEMGVAQLDLINWVDAKMVEQKKEVEDATKNLAIYIKNKWRSDPLRQVVTKAQKMYEYYEKMKAALNAGYVIIPNFPNNAYSVFAIKTKKRNPARNQVRGQYAYPQDQKTSSPPLGQGKYVSPDAELREHTDEVRKSDGKTETHVTRWADDFRNIEFPIRLAKPEILEDAAAALKTGIFDELVISPALPGNSRSINRTKSSDPMVMGRIVHRDGYSTKAVTFLITWFVDTKDL